MESGRSLKVGFRAGTLACETTPSFLFSRRASRGWSAAIYAQREGDAAPFVIPGTQI